MRFIFAITLALLFSWPAHAQCGGTPGTAGIPRLSADAATLGSTMDFDIFRGKPGAFYLIVATAGGGQLPTPIGTICLNMAAPIYANSGFLDARGETTLSIPIPNLPSLRNFPVHAQAAILDSGNTTGYALTNSIGTRVTPPYGVVSGWNRSTGGHIMRIDMISGAVLDTVRAGGRPIPVTRFDRSGRYLFAAGDSGANLYLVDYGVTPPKVTPLSVGTAGSIYGLAVTRDGRYLYASAYGQPRGAAGTTWVVDADALSPTFFKVLATVKAYPTSHSETQATRARSG